MERLVEIAKHTYKSLIDHPRFIEFYSQATPIDVLERSNIGSRPARRTGKRSLQDLRSIPWVFSWSLARFNLSGWFGTGTAFAKFKETYPEDFEFLKAAVSQWPFLKYGLIQTETNLLNTDPHIMQAFANLCADKDVEKELMLMILTDFEAGVAEIDLIMGSTSQERRGSRLEGNAMRKEGLDILHHMQLSSLKEWRSLKPDEQEKGDHLLLELLLLVNAVSGGLKGTG
jgi:phosphoenolpyruvate carboxylase